MVTQKPGNKDHYRGRGIVGFLPCVGDANAVLGGCFDTYPVGKQVLGALCRFLLGMVRK